jgi:hypothetical protein
MKKLLSEDTFDTFLLVEASVKGKVELSLNGRLNDSFFPDDKLNRLLEKGQFIPYGMVRKILFDSMIGEYLPSSFSIILSCPSDLMRKVAGDNPDPVNGMYLNFRYRQEKLILTTGVSMKTFSIDKSAETLFDNFVPKLMESVKIAFEEAN